MTVGSLFLLCQKVEKAAKNFGGFFASLYLCKQE